MASKDKETREAQKKRAEELLALKLKELQEQGKTKEIIEKTPVIKKIKAQIRDATQRLRSIEQKETKREQALVRKQEKAAQPKVKDKKKAASAEQTGQKKKKKKEKKKKD